MLSDIPFWWHFRVIHKFWGKKSRFLVKMHSIKHGHDYGSDWWWFVWNRRQIMSDGLALFELHVLSAYGEAASVTSPSSIQRRIRSHLWCPMRVQSESGGPCGAVKCAKTHKCANAHICANISPTNVQTTTFVQTFRPQMCKQTHLYYYKNLGCVYVCMCVMFMQATFPLMDQLHILHNHRSWPWRWPMAI